MPTHDEHMARVEQNKALLLHLKQTEKHGVCGDWYVTISFYTASNCVEAMFYVVKPMAYRKMGVTVKMEHSRGHRDRNKMLRYRFKDIFKSYTTLYSYSRIARYRDYIPVSPNGKSAEQLFQDIEAKCKKAIGDN